MTLAGTEYCAVPLPYLLFTCSHTPYAHPHSTLLSSWFSVVCVVRFVQCRTNRHHTGGWCGCGLLCTVCSFLLYFSNSTPSQCLDWRGSKKVLLMWSLTSASFSVRGRHAASMLLSTMAFVVMPTSVVAT